MTAPPTHPTAPEPAVVVEDVTVDYGEVRALEGVDLTIGAARIRAILGTNGSGKSTLFKSLLGLVMPQRGTVTVHGQSTARARRAGLLAYVPQSEQVDWSFPLRVWDVTMMGRYGHMGFTRRPRAHDREAVAEALSRTGLTELADRQIGALSGGQRKRAFVARGLAQDAAVFLLDEPFAGVDTGSQATITEVLRDMRDRGHTVVVSTHDLAGVPALCDEATLLHNRVIAEGTPDDVLTPERVMEVFGTGSTHMAAEA
ncbi:metal ABC transporter ATP-binding protein [Spiractinospora alimapuensis]|uniref:metal ABC transporter ATP-binding protein n=1 Tax=Spiractinospora alimapuensis TaxID=2820884 RepID=UPI001F38EBE3|nr:metal ABC transporter ATP-binding protein [Spiractinospora alimapuensis]QVQ52592.1 metal ABC transporter ATP-binding protein [Spiractinospora alimapuensis]